MSFSFHANLTSTVFEKSLCFREIFSDLRHFIAFYKKKTKKESVLQQKCQKYNDVPRHIKYGLAQMNFYEYQMIHYQNLEMLLFFMLVSFNLCIQEKKQTCFKCFFPLSISLQRLIQKKLYWPKNILLIKNPQLQSNPYKDQSK